MGLSVLLEGLGTLHTWSAVENSIAQNYCPATNVKIHNFPQHQSHYDLLKEFLFTGFLSNKDKQQVKPPKAASSLQPELSGVSKI